MVQIPVKGIFIGDGFLADQLRLLEFNRRWRCGRGWLA